MVREDMNEGTTLVVGSWNRYIEFWEHSDRQETNTTGSHQWEKKDMHKLSANMKVTLKNSWKEENNTNKINTGICKWYGNITKQEEKKRLATYGNIGRWSY